MATCFVVIGVAQNFLPLTSMLFDSFTHMCAWLHLHNRLDLETQTTNGARSKKKTVFVKNRSVLLCEVGEMTDEHSNDRKSSSRP